MILDKGICTIFRPTDASAAGRKPTPSYTTLVCQSWYGELSFETAPQLVTEGREAIHASERIRVLQDRAIDNQCVAVLRSCTEIEDNDTVYAIARAYHGKDEANGQPISDLTLEVMEK